MILAGYPGHLIAAALLAGGAVLMFFGYRTEIVRKAGAWRWLLAVMQYACIGAILLIIWDPSLPITSENASRNTVLAVFDTSESMSSTDGADESRLDKAVTIFKESFGASDPETPRFAVYGFDSNCYANDSVDTLRRWGPRTNLRSVFGVLERYVLTGIEAKAATTSTGGSSRVVGAVVFTDGQAEDKNVGSYFPVKDTDVTILVVGVGSQEVPRDVAVTSVRVPSQVALNTPYSAEVDIATTGVRNARINVALFEDDTLIDVRDLEVQGDAGKLTLSFAVGARVLGRHRIAARAQLSGNEPNLANNRHETTLQVVQASRLKVLLYSQVASFDFGKVRASLERDKKIDVDIGLDAVINPDTSQTLRSMSGHVPLPKTKEGLYAYDVVVFGPCDFNTFSADQTEALYGYVAERGGGVVFLPGREDRDIAACTTDGLRALLPVEFAAERGNPNSERAAMTLTAEGRNSGMLAESDLKDFAAEAKPFRTGVVPKPAASVMAKAGGSPIVCVQRVGRGRTCYINTYGLFRWYREDLEGGLLRRFLSSLTTQVGRIPSREASVDLFASRSADDPFKVAFEAHVYDQSFASVDAATVLLDVGGKTIRMEGSGEGRYLAELGNLRDESVVARVQAEKGGVFLGEKTVTASLPCPRGELDHIELDKVFLEGLAKKIGGKYLDAKDVKKSTIDMFEAFSTGTTFGIRSVWQSWGLLLGLCVLLSTIWFIRRAIGLI